MNQQEIATPKNCRKSHTRAMVYIATMVAISIVLKLISNSLSQTLPSSLKISFAYLGWYLSAAILGPWAGGFVALTSDLLGQWLSPVNGAPNPILLIGNFLNGFIFGLIFKYVKFKNLPPFVDLMLRALLGVVSSTLCCTLGVNTFGLWLYYYKSTAYIAFTLTRLTQLLSVAVNYALFAALLPALDSLELLPRKLMRRNNKSDDSAA